MSNRRLRGAVQNGARPERGAMTARDARPPEWDGPFLPARVFGARAARIGDDGRGVGSKRKHGLH